MSAGSLIPYRWAGVGQVEGGLSGSAGAGCVSWLFLVCLRSVWFSMLCVCFVAPLSGSLGWDLYLVVVYLVVTGETPYEVVLVRSGE